MAPMEAAAKAQLCDCIAACFRFFVFFFQMALCSSQFSPPAPSSLLCLTFSSSFFFFNINDDFFSSFQRGLLFSTPSGGRIKKEKMKRGKKAFDAAIAEADVEINAAHMCGNNMFEVSQ